MHTLKNIDAWRVLVALSEGQGIKGAALSVGIDLPACSRLVSKLSEETGIELLDHNVRPAQLTKDALYLLECAKQLTDAYDELKRRIESSAQKEITIRVGIPVNNPRKSIYALLKRYEELDPYVRFEVFSDTDHNDVLSGAVDVAYLPYRPPSEGLFIWDIGTIGNVPLVSTSYLTTHPLPKTPEDLAEHDVIIRCGPYYPLTTTLQKGDESRPFVYKNIVLAGDSPSCKEAVLSGDGVAIDLSIAYCRDEIADGRLIPILNGWHRPMWEKTLVISREQLGNSRLVSFARYFVKHESHASERRNASNNLLIQQWFGCSESETS